MKILKKNQVIIYTMALMLVTAGYLNYTNNIKKETVETSIQEENTIKTKKTENVVENALVPNDNTNSTKNETVETSKKVADIGDATLVNSNDVVTNYFAKSRLERDSMYSQMLESYQNVLNGNNISESQKQSATKEIEKINKTKNSIMICENLIQTKGFENSVIFVNGDSVSVIIGSKKLKKEEIAQIQNIVSRELGVDVEKIHISVK